MKLYLTIMLAAIALILTFSSAVAQEENHELVFWNSIEHSTIEADFRAYLERYPDGLFATLARNRLEHLDSWREDSLELTREERRQIQSGLIVAGFTPGPINGLFGEQTRAAIGAWHLAQGAEESGYLNADSAVKLLTLGEPTDEDRHGTGVEPIVAVQDATRVSASVAHTCALRDDGKAVCWPDILDAASPPSSEQFVSISSGGTHTCGLREDGRVVCWGDNTDGKATPPPDERLVAISSGGAHTCGLRADRSVVCWGDETYGEATPPPNERLVTISSGVGHTCGLRADGSPVCWGIDVSAWSLAGERLISIDSGLHYTCGVLTDRSAKCWGILGDQVSPPRNEQLISISAGYAHACGLQEDGSPVCWQLGDLEQRGQANPPATERFVSISSGAFHTCAMREDGSVLCWGLDELDSPPSLSFTAARIVDDHSDLSRDATELVTSVSGQIETIGDVDYFRFEIQDRSSVIVYSTGDLDTFGTLEPEPTAGFFEPIDTDDDGGDSYNFRIQRMLDAGIYYIKVGGYDTDTGAYSIHLVVNAPLSLRMATGDLLSSGWSHTCALRPDGTAVCWGSNADGEATPPHEERFVSISSGAKFTCGLHEDGSPLCWGNDDYGQTVPPAGERFAVISSGFNYVCGLREDGGVICWGRDDDGQATPPDDDRFVAVSSRYSHTLRAPRRRERSLLGPKYRWPGDTACRRAIRRD